MECILFVYFKSEGQKTDNWCDALTTGFLEFKRFHWIHWTIIHMRVSQNNKY